MFRQHDYRTPPSVLQQNTRHLEKILEPVETTDSQMQSAPQGWNSPPAPWCPVAGRSPALKAAAAQRSLLMKGVACTVTALGMPLALGRPGSTLGRDGKSVIFIVAYLEVSIVYAGYGSNYIQNLCRSSSIS